MPSSQASIKIWVLFIILLFSLGVNFFLLFRNNFPDSLTQPLTLSPTPVPTPLQQYSFDALSSRPITPSPIQIESVLEETDSYTAYLFSYQTEGKKVTGQLNLPLDYQDRLSPIIVMIRGYVPLEIFSTGVGTKNAAAVYASQGYITIAPDFLGYGGSDDSDPDQFATRLMRPLTVLSLLESIKQLEYVDQNNIFLWGHSNGGQISLSVLEITGASYPTTLWAPVSKPFPYNVLFYTDEYDDFGTSFRRDLAAFETIYNANDFSIGHYLDRINAPLQIHQGGADIEVPINWSDDLVRDLQRIIRAREASPAASLANQLEVTYYPYPSADHNLRPNWDQVVARDLIFFEKHLR